MSNKPAFEYRIIVNQYNNVLVYRKYDDPKYGASDANGLRFVGHAHPPMTGSEMRESEERLGRSVRAGRPPEARIGTFLPRQCVERIIDLAIATYTDAPITIIVKH